MFIPYFYLQLSNFPLQYRKQGFYHEPIGDVINFTPTINSGMLQYHQPKPTSNGRSKQKSRNPKNRNQIMGNDQYNYDNDLEGNEHNQDLTDGDDDDRIGENVYDINDFDDVQRKPFQHSQTSAAGHVRFQQPETQGGSQQQQQQSSQQAPNVPINVNEIMGNVPLRASSNSSRNSSNSGFKP
jgi:hypothetical protein